MAGRHTDAFDVGAFAQPLTVPSADTPCRRAAVPTLFKSDGDAKRAQQSGN